jgi:uncharacterized protein with PQ loop repeat
MTHISVPTLAGIASTVIFACSMLPMLTKAHRTRDLASYSLGNLVLANIGNAVHSVYVFSLPVGPIWALHGFYLATSWLMLVWCLRYGRAAGLRKPPLRDGSRVPQRRPQPTGTAHSGRQPRRSVLPESARWRVDLRD